MKVNKKISFLKLAVFSLMIIISINSFSRADEEERGNRTVKKVTTPAVKKEVTTAKYQRKENSPPVEYIDIYDPWEGFNRRVYIFNYYADKYVVLPIVDAYRFITPDPLERGVNNFFVNSTNVRTMANSVAQGKGKKFMETLGRFSMNSILGLLGIMDVATELEMPVHYEDFGTTLGYYGVPDGPYMVLPLIGPSNVKNAVGLGVDTFVVGGIHPYTKLDLVNMSNVELITANGINLRKNTQFRYYDSGSPFEYEYVRFIYTKYRSFIEKE